MVSIPKIIGVMSLSYSLVSVLESVHTRAGSNEYWA